MKRQTRDVWVSVGTILAGFAVIVALAVMMGCASTPRTECPEIDVPEVVEVPVFIPPSLLLTPTPPAFIEPTTPEDIARNWIELVRAWREALAIITGHNAAIIETD